MVLLRLFRFLVIGKCKNMKKLLSLLILVLSLSAFAQNDQVFKDAHATPRTLNGSFTAISVSSGIDLYITQGNEESVAVSAIDQKHRDLIITEVVNGTLKIHYDNRGVTWKTGNKKLKAWVSFKNLEKLKAEAGSNVLVSGSIRADKLDLDISSGAGFKGDVQTTYLSADISSGAGVRISGKTDQLSVDVSSGADFKGYDFATNYCTASASSGASVHVTINKELTAKASSGADIKYKGEALIREMKVSGGGGVKKV